ncbi:MAG: hypothetical protein L6Q46_01075, partial [Flavobacterium sp.]|nr:hypothetical protein [Flavobacterium sp.]
APSLTSQHPLILSEEYLKMDYFFYSAHHLSKVTDNNGEELVTYLYEEFIEPDLVNPHPSTNLITNKLSQINAIDHGKIIFDFDKVLSPLQKDNDPIQLQNIEVKDNHNNTIKKYNFEYSGISLTIGVIDHRTKRILSKIIENNNDDTQNNEYKFKYINNVNNTNPFFCDENYYGLDPFGYLTSALNINNLVEDTEVDVDYLGDLNADFNRYRPSKDLVNFGVIEEITYPTGGRVKYEFESHTYSFNENQSNMFYDIPIQEVYKARNFDNHVYSELYNSNYDTSTLYSNSIPLNITGTSPVKLYFKLLSNPYYSNLNDPVNEPLYATCRLIGNGVDFYIDNYSVTCLGDYIEVQPGIYTIQFFSVGNEPATGHLKITKKETITQPIKEWFYGGGLRIKKISHFNSLLVNAMPVNEINYDYQMFDNSNKSSGEMYDGYFRNFLSGLGTVTQVSYRNVKIFNSLNNGFIKHTYESYVDSPFYPSSPLYPNSGYYQNYFGFKNGLLKKTEYYNSSNVLLKKIENEYDFEERGDAMIISSMLYVGSIFSTKVVWAKLIATNITEYFLQSGNTETTLTGKTFSYNSLNLKNSENTITNSQGETLKTKYFYHRGNSIHSQNRISEIERVETYRGSELLSKSQIVYNNNWANNVSFLPQTIKTAKGNEAYENRLHNLQYDEFSNPLEVQQEGGIHICYIWGYNKTQPVAKLENIAYSSIPTSHIQAIETASNSNNEASLITALNALRNDAALSNAMITTYTYKPLVGISTVTDPKGDKQTYHYDSFNRLEFVKDAQGNILSENQYHYRTQN